MTEQHTLPEARFQVRTERGYCQGEEDGAYLFHRQPRRQRWTLAEAEKLAAVLKMHYRLVEITGRFT